MNRYEIIVNDKKIFIKGDRFRLETDGLFIYEGSELSGHFKDYIGFAVHKIKDESDKNE